MAYTSSTTYLFTRLQVTFSSCEPKEEWPHAGLYNYVGRQIKGFHIKWFNWCLCEMPDVGASVQKFNNNLRTLKQTKIYHKSNVFNVGYQQSIRIVFFFNSKLNDCAEWNVHGELANITDNRTVSYKHFTESILV